MSGLRDVLCAAAMPNCTSKSAIGLILCILVGRWTEPTSNWAAGDAHVGKKGFRPNLVGEFACRNIILNVFLTTVAPLKFLIAD